MLKEMKRVKNTIEEIVDEKGITKDESRYYQREVMKFRIENLHFIPKENPDTEEFYINLFAAKTDRYKITGQLQNNRLNFKIKAKDNKCEFVVKLKENSYEIVLED